MLARTLGFGLSGVNGFAVKVEVYAANGLPALEIIGLPDASVKESRDRVGAAIKNAGFSMPISRLTVNLAPADMKKEGPAFDLPIAVGVLMASNQLEQMDLKTMQEFGAWLQQENLQAIATRVSRGSECTIIIEDGQIAGQPLPELPVSNPWKAGVF